MHPLPTKIAKSNVNKDKIITQFHHCFAQHFYRRHALFVLNDSQTCDKLWYHRIKNIIDCPFARFRIVYWTCFPMNWFESYKFHIKKLEIISSERDWMNSLINWCNRWMDDYMYLHFKRKSECSCPEKSFKGQIIRSWLNYRKSALINKMTGRKTEKRVSFLVYYLCDKFQRFGLRAHMYIHIILSWFSSFEKTMNEWASARPISILFVDG